MTPVKPVVIHEDQCELEYWNDPSRGILQWKTLISADRTPSQSMTCGVGEIPPEGSGGGLQIHQHAPAEVYHLLEGTGVVTIDQIDYPVKQGSTVFIPANAKHGLKNTGTTVLKFFYIFAVDSFEEVEYVFSQTPS